MLQKLIGLCQAHGIAYPVECLINLTSYTCYNYGPRGARFRRYIINEWWKSCNRTNANIHLVENASLPHIPNITQPPTNDASNKFLSSLSEGILQHYLPTLSQVRSRLPFGSAQIGRCTQALTGSSDIHRFIYSSAEQTDLVLHLYVPPAEASQWMDRLQATRLQWWTKFSKTPSAFTSLSGQPEGGEDVPTINIQYTFPWGSDAVETICNHGSKPLLELQDLFGVSLEGLSAGRYVLPDLLEVHTTVERATSAFLSDAFHEKDVTLGKSHEQRQVLRLHPLLTPYYVALVTEGHAGNPEDLLELTRHLATEMRGLGISVLDVHEISPEGATNMTRYDETGVMWTVILSQKTLEAGVALMRNRDTTIKERINISDLCKRLIYHLRTS